MMSQAMRLKPAGQKKPKKFMSAELYREFVESFQKVVKSDLDKQREARVRSEEESKRHLIG
jgi:hypothetical protein